jgi:hypothetical protein
VAQTAHQVMLLQQVHEHRQQLRRSHPTPLRRTEKKKPAPSRWAACDTSAAMACYLMARLVVVEHDHHPWLWALAASPIFFCPRTHACQHHQQRSPHLHSARTQTHTLSRRWHQNTSEHAERREP